MNRELSNSAADVGSATSLPPHLRSHYLDVGVMPWVETEFPGIQMKVLYSDPTSGMSTILFKMEPGAVVPLHEHTSVEQTYVLEGSLDDAEGRCGAGEFVWRPGGNCHIAHAPAGAVFISFFTKPNRFVHGGRFFTEA